MKIILKVILIMSIVTMLLISDLVLVKDVVQAENKEVTNMYKKTYCEPVIVRAGIARGSTFVVYNKDGVEHPAYCVSPDTDGVAEAGPYDVTISGKIQDIGVWRVLINGYPYKSLEDLGVENEREAYLATKQAVYCYLLNRDPNVYSSNGTLAGDRTLSALKQIVANANSSTEVPETARCMIEANISQWNQDDIDKNYVSKIYEVSSKVEFQDYKVSISGERIPEGLKISDINNNERQEFKNNEKFKILIPIYNLNNDGNFTINLETKTLTKPVLFGLAPQGLQNYALATYEFEESKNTYNESYGENKTTINILKQDQNTKEPLAGVEFQILNENREVIYGNLVTDENGKISVKGLMPGTYYLKEINSLNGYMKYEEQIEINIELNETLYVTVNNLKENKIEVVSQTKEIEVVSQTKEIEVVSQTKEIEVKKLPKTGM